jgi:dinuclear metal center YbgI/SA1388 family protein
MSGADPVALATVMTYLDTLLRISEIPDDPGAVNGLQVENGGKVRRIVAAVDASQATIDGAVREGSGPGTLLLVHHGLFWEGNVPLTGRRMRRIRSLLENDVALYSAHIPLDVHPELGNNAALGRLLGIRIEGWFGNQRGVPLGVYGQLELHREELTRLLEEGLGAPARLIPGGPEKTRRVGVITGGAGSMIAAARDSGLDTYVTGEGAHHHYFDATEWGLNVIFAGHYATETLGVQRLAEHLSKRFSIPWEFHDHPTGL